MQIEDYKDEYLDAVVALSLRAWEPVFDSLQEAIKPEIYNELYPDGWLVSQKKAVEDTCSMDETDVWVAVEEDKIAGFVAVKLHAEAKMGEIYMIAVDPENQRRGVATALTDYALKRMKKAGMSVAMVETGGDPGHSPARRTYEKTGFELLSIARYFKKL